MAAEKCVSRCDQSKGLHAKYKKVFISKIKKKIKVII